MIPKIKHLKAKLVLNLPTCSLIQTRLTFKVMNSDDLLGLLKVLVLINSSFIPFMFPSSQSSNYSLTISLDCTKLIIVSSDVSNENIIQV